MSRWRPPAVPPPTVDWNQSGGPTVTLAPGGVASRGDGGRRTGTAWGRPRDHRSSRPGSDGGGPRRRARSRGVIAARDRLGRSRLGSSRRSASRTRRRSDGRPRESGMVYDTPDYGTPQPPDQGLALRRSHAATSVASTRRGVLRGPSTVGGLTAPLND
jgi:hypothetical protein